MVVVLAGIVIKVKKERPKKKGEKKPKITEELDVFIIKSPNDKKI